MQRNECTNGQTVAFVQGDALFSGRIVFTVASGDVRVRVSHRNGDPLTYPRVDVVDADDLLKVVRSYDRNLQRVDYDRPPIWDKPHHHVGTGTVCAECGEAHK